MLIRSPRVFALSAALTLSGTLLVATVMTGGILQMVKTLVLSGAGASNKTGGALSVAHSLGQPNARTMSGGAYSLTSGYHAEVTVAGIAPLVLSAQIPSPAVVGNELVGVPPSPALSFTFSKPMDPSTLAGATSVIGVLDKDGNPAQNPAAFTIVYDAPTNTMTVSPTAPLARNNVYTLAISSAARSADGNALNPVYATRFRTIFDNAQRNVFADSAGGTKLVAPALSFATSGYIVIRTDPVNNPDRASPACILAANAKIVADYGPFKTPLLIREVNAYDVSNAPIQPAAPDAATLLLRFQEDAQGFVTPSAPPIRPATLAAWVLDCGRQLWLKLPASVLDAQARTVSAPLPHLSVFTLAGDADTDVSQVYAFPVPWKPRAGNPARYGTMSSGITFANLPSQGTLRIYTVSGELVRNIDHASGALTETWDGTNVNGSPVASGVYLWEMRSGTNSKTGKLMVVW